MAEPVNLVSNGAFLVMAYWLWPRAQPGSGARTLVILLAAIGLGSALFHSVAQRWAAVVDVTPILLFVLYYIYLANRQFWQLSRLLSLVGVALFFPYAAAVLWVFKDIEGLGSSLGYMPVPILIAVYAIGLHRRFPQVARGLWGGVLPLVCGGTFICAFGISNCRLAILHNLAAGHAFFMAFDQCGNVGVDD